MQIKKQSSLIKKSETMIKKRNTFQSMRKTNLIQQNTLIQHNNESNTKFVNIQLKSTPKRPLSRNSRQNINDIDSAKTNFRIKDLKTNNLFQNTNPKNLYKSKGFSTEKNQFKNKDKNSSIQTSSKITQRSNQKKINPEENNKNIFTSNFKPTTLINKRMIFNTNKKQCSNFNTRKSKIETDKINILKNNQVQVNKNIPAVKRLEPRIDFQEQIQVVHKDKPQQKVLYNQRQKEHKQLVEQPCLSDSSESSEASNNINNFPVVQQFDHQEFPEAQIPNIQNNSINQAQILSQLSNYNNHNNQNQSNNPRQSLNSNLNLSTLINNTQQVISFINRLNLQRNNAAFDIMVSQLTQLNAIAIQIHQLGQMGNSLGYSLVNAFGNRIRELQTTIISQVGQALITSFEERMEPEFQALVLRFPTLRQGFNKTEISELFQEKFTFTQIQCSICLEDVKKSQKIIELQCHHNFHPICIKTWLQNSRKCPLCRKEQQKNS